MIFLSLTSIIEKKKKKKRNSTTTLQIAQQEYTFGFIENSVYVFNSPSHKGGLYQRLIPMTMF